MMHVENAAFSSSYLIARAVISMGKDHLVQAQNSACMSIACQSGNSVVSSLFLRKGIAKIEMGTFILLIIKCIDNENLEQVIAF